MKNTNLLNLVGEIDDKYIEEAAPKTMKSHKSVLPKWAVAACLCLVFAITIQILPQFNNGSIANPLVITVYACDETGNLIPTALSVGEKVKLSPAKSSYTENFNGYAFELTLLGAKYVSVCATDENWNPKLYPGWSYEYTESDFNWSLTEGDEIIIVWPDKNGNIIRADELMGPKPHGSEIIWRPNNVGLNRTIIGIYDDDFELLVTYYLEILEMEEDYYAEIVKVN